MRLHLGDCRDLLAGLEAGSVDSVVCDPPYGLGRPPPIEDVLRSWLAGDVVEVSGGGFMGSKWDAFVPGPDIWREVFRVLKPGGHAVVFAGQRTVDVMGVALRLGGFEVRDLVGWQYWSGFPKSLDVSKAIDRAAGAEREPDAYTGPNFKNGVYGRGMGGGVTLSRGEPATPDAKRWEGWGTALKPCIEPALLVRKPLDGTVAGTVLAHGTGALNVDGCRYPFGDSAWPGPQENSYLGRPGSGSGAGSGVGAEIYGRRGGRDGSLSPGMEIGRWPANVYACPKPSTKERERGCDGLPVVSAGELVDRAEGSAGIKSPSAGAGRKSSGRRNIHPTVKPVRLLRWLVRLVTPPGGVVLDPFAGSGSCGVAAVLEGVDYLGAEMGEEYHRIAVARVKHAQEHPEEWLDTRPGPPVTKAEEARVEAEAAGQVGLFGDVLG